MLFEFDADQRLWQDTVRDAVARHCLPALIREVADKGGDSGALWQTYVKSGWTELTEQAGAVELAIVVEELGRATDPTPFLATMTQFTPLAGALARPDRPGAAVFDGMRARQEGAGWLLDGHCEHVLDADRAEAVALVTDAGVFVVPAGELSVERAAVFDPVLHVASVTATGVRVGPAQRTDADPARARQIALTGLALTIVGACRRILDLTLDHVRNRQQFDAPIGSFQAVKHKAADMHVAIERARALAYFAALALATDDPRRALASAMAKAGAGECQSLVFRNGFQLFGAMGFTWENDLQFALKRAKACELLLGGAAHHRALIAEEHRATDI
jgi:alkylation response protein AidB-like acyl-CoA dehydrogenase